MANACMLSRASPASASSFTSPCHSAEIACSSASLHVSFPPRSTSISNSLTGAANGARQCDRAGNASPVEMHSSKSGVGFCNVKKLKGKIELISPSAKVELPESWFSAALLPALSNLPLVLCFSGSAHAEVSDEQINHIYGDIGAGLNISAQVLYLAALLGLVGVASYFVVKQVLIRRDLETAARDLQDRVRTGEALPVEYFELGAVMLRKKFYVLASRYLEQAIAKWDGDPQDLAQVHNALGYSYVSDDNVDRGIAEYQKALKLQPGYVVAWNNLGSAYEKKKNLQKALEAYEQALLFDPNNAVAKEFRDMLKERVKRLQGVPMTSD